MIDKRVMIIGTVPYELGSTSRAFGSYFHGKNLGYLSQIFSDPKNPIKGQCSRMYQITDSMLLKRWIYRKQRVGISYEYDELMDESSSRSEVKSNFLIKSLYLLGSKKIPFTHMMRKILWKRKYWCTTNFVKWLDEVKPEVLFLSFSNDFFLFDIAEYVSNRYNIPIISVIGDDYFFNNRIALSPIYYIYRFLYKKRIKKHFIKHNSAIFISNKIKRKYQEEFNLIGETVYLTSNLKRREFKKINIHNPLIVYLGNLGLGRHKALIDIAIVLRKINPRYKIEIYSNRYTKKIFNELRKYPNIICNDAIGYDMVEKKLYESDLVLLVEGFTKNNVKNTRYSLSTKVADLLKSGSNVFAYGSIDTGMMGYIRDNNACYSCIEKKSLFMLLKEYIFCPSEQEFYYKKAVEISEINHNQQYSFKLTADVINKAINEHYKNK